MRNEITDLLAGPAALPSFTIERNEKARRWLRECSRSELVDALEQLEVALESLGRPLPLEAQSEGWRETVNELIHLARARLKAELGAPPSRAEAIAASLSAKAHAAKALRLLGLKPTRPAELRETMGLEDS